MKTALASYTTFRIGGPCRNLIECLDPASLKNVLQTLIQKHEPYVLIGGGSNILVSDCGVDAVVVRYFSEKPQVDTDGTRMEVSGCTILEHVVRAATDQGLKGVGMCSGIPGTVGGAVVGNAGAFGKQIGDVIESVELINKDGAVYWADAEELELGYRRSRLQRSGEVVLTVRLCLQSSDRDALWAERDSILALRREKHPDWRREPCIGSFFRNVESTSAAGRRQAAGWFLEQAGAKDMRVGGAFVYPKHANIIVKDEDGTARDVFRLATRMAQAVKDRFGLELQREIRYLGHFADSPDMPTDRVF